MTKQLPGTSEQELRKFLLEHYAIDAALTRLGSEHDETYRVSLAGADDLIVKVCALDEPREFVELQVAVVDHLARSSTVPVPVPVPTPGGATITRWQHPGGLPVRLVHVMTCLPGIAVAEQVLSTEQAERLGTVHGELTAALAAFRQPAADRRIMWDLSLVGELVDTVAAPRSQARVADQVVSHFTRFVRPVAEKGDRQIVHGDYSVHNVLTDAAAPGFVTGVIDFGDVHAGPVLYDLAIAVSNLLDHRLAEPWSLASAHVRGFLNVRDIPPVQLRVLAAAAAARCVQRALISQWRASTDPTRADYVHEHSRHDWVRAETAIQTLDTATDQFLAAAPSDAPTS
ncbi:phosphotransferase [Nocardioides panzhihuensis]|uniref:Ser/Thr protein kinase RdoA (MazF antagonist) n=1 Tax=Nocardioides panzhihuensis TaxID=860243 RepID=A0A7Z0DIB3_9ACTN|nr:phosphotransferase [Nocardioides panzhihuensis]NYI75838.1 Ser/Thr protein kinase RdoA (MazF antagonist) [Nocardioides panzhihuensis]